MFQKNRKTFWMQCDFFIDVIICQYFLQETYLLLVFVRLKTLVLFFLCFLAFCEFQCLFYKNTFVLTFFMGMFYFILIWKGLKTIRLKMILMFPATLQQKIIHPCNYAWFFTKQLIVTNWKSKNFRFIDLVDFYSYHCFRLYT